jgi:hypothetical protein
MRKADIGDLSRDLIVNNADRVNMETNVYGILRTRSPQDMR